MSALRFELRFERFARRLELRPTTPGARAWLARPDVAVATLLVWAKHRDAPFAPEPPAGCPPPPAGVLCPSIVAAMIVARWRELFPDARPEIDVDAPPGE